MVRFLVALSLVAALAGCKPDYSADSYNSTAVQQANKVDQAVIVGRRQVGVTPSGTIGAVSGGAAGGIAGSQIGGGVTSAFGALGGSLVGGVVGSAVERAQGQTTAFEYIVRKTTGELLSVTQQDALPLVVGQKVLVIAGSQARIVPDYTVALDPAPPAEHTEAKLATPQPVIATELPPPPGTPPPDATAATNPLTTAPGMMPPPAVPALPGNP